MANRWGHYWTPDEDRRLRELAADGYSVADAAAELGRTRWACKARSREIKAGFRRGNGRYDLWQRVAVVDGVREGLTQKQIAERMGKDLDWVCRLVTQLVRAGVLARSGRKRSVKLWVKK